jgi:hypothetical protein
VLLTITLEQAVLLKLLLDGLGYDLLDLLALFGEACEHTNLIGAQYWSASIQNGS